MICYISKFHRAASAFFRGAGDEGVRVWAVMEGAKEGRHRSESDDGPCFTPSYLPTGEDMIVRRGGEFV